MQESFATSTGTPGGGGTNPGSGCPTTEVSLSLFRAPSWPRNDGFQPHRLLPAAVGTEFGDIEVSAVAREAGAVQRRPLVTGALLSVANADDDPVLNVEVAVEGALA